MAREDRHCKIMHIQIRFLLCEKKNMRDSNDNVINPALIQSINKHRETHPSDTLQRKKKTRTEPREEEKETNHEAKGEGSYNGNRDRNGGKLNVADMANENASD